MEKRKIIRYYNSVSMSVTYQFDNLDYIHICIEETNKYLDIFLCVELLLRDYKEPTRKIVYDELTKNYNFDKEIWHNMDYSEKDKVIKAIVTAELHNRLKSIDRNKSLCIIYE